MIIIIYSRQFRDGHRPHGHNLSFKTLADKHFKVKKFPKSRTIMVNIYWM